MPPRPVPCRSPPRSPRCCCPAAVAPLLLHRCFCPTLPPALGRVSSDACPLGAFADARAGTPVLTPLPCPPLDRVRFSGATAPSAWGTAAATTVRARGRTAAAKWRLGRTRAVIRAARCACRRRVHLATTHSPPTRPRPEHANGRYLRPLESTFPHWTSRKREREPNILNCSSQVWTMRERRVGRRN